jgi:hypothetical protein
MSTITSKTEYQRRLLQKCLNTLVVILQPRSAFLIPLLGVVLNSVKLDMCICNIVRNIYLGNAIILVTHQWQGCEHEDDGWNGCWWWQNLVLWCGKQTTGTQHSLARWRCCIWYANSHEAPYDNWDAAYAICKGRFRPHGFYGLKHPQCRQLGTYTWQSRNCYTDCR